MKSSILFNQIVNYFKIVEFKSISFQTSRKNPNFSSAPKKKEHEETKNEQKMIHFSRTNTNQQLFFSRGWSSKVLPVDWRTGWWCWVMSWWVDVFFVFFWNIQLYKYMYIYIIYLICIVRKWYIYYKVWKGLICIWQLLNSLPDTLFGDVWSRNKFQVQEFLHLDSVLVCNSYMSY